MDIGGAIKILRREAGYTQPDFADLVGVTQATISQIENGQRPGEQTLAKIASVLQMPIPLIYMMAVERDDIPEHKRLIYDTLEPALKAILLQFAG